MSGNSSWLQRQRKSDLVELADNVGLKGYDSLKKADLETSLDEYLSENASRLSSNPKLAPYYSGRSKNVASPVKKEAPVKEADDKAAIKVTKRKSKSADDGDASTAVARTPAPSRTLSIARRIPLPATPRDVANAVDRGATAIRSRAASLYKESGVTEARDATREALSTVQSVLFVVSAFELYYLRPELLRNRYAFTIPGISAIGTPAIPVWIPDFFLLLTTEFWSPALTWAFTSTLVPALFGYFFNLSAASHASSGRGRPRAHGPEYTVDPLTFSVVKALLTYVVYAQGVSFGGWIDPVSVMRINSALYGGWPGVLVGTAITGLAAIYDAVLKK